jgi:hypothetical protein
MPIPFSCPCGKALAVKDELAGKRIRCPACGEVRAVPTARADADLEVVEADAPVRPPAAPEPPRKAKGKKKKSRAERARDRKAADEDYDRWLERSYWRKRMIRAWAYITLGLIISGGGIYLLAEHRKDINPLYSALILVCGVAAIGKGVIGLLFGEFFDEGD